MKKAVEPPTLHPVIPVMPSISSEWEGRLQKMEELWTERLRQAEAVFEEKLRIVEERWEARWLSAQVCLTPLRKQYTT